MAAIDSLSPRERRGLAFLIAAPSIADAARHAGISTRTFRRWLQREDFSQALTESARTAYSATIRRGQAASEQALETLLEVAADHAAPANARVAAARAILDLAVPLVVMDRTARRISETEKKRNSSRGEPPP